MHGSMNGEKKKKQEFKFMMITHYAIFSTLLPVPPSGVGKIWQTKESRDQFQTSLSVRQ
jgi:hypothetical protein